MNNLTKAQYRWLEWLNAHGGKAWPKGLVLIPASGHDQTNSAAAISFVNLVAKGAIEGGPNGCLQITDYGRRLLTP
ncbi:MAG: hypothetical protein M0Z28_26050 [Rhodospirillales bacterium]|nr:hypothetical protein [Rhodospirillales bacterium]